MATSLSLLVSLWPVVIGLWVLYTISVAIHRRYFHPLSSIPGPSFNAISYLPILYQQGILEGQLLHALERWHAQYGPIIRISPNEIHLSSPEYYETIYSNALKTGFYKDPAFYGPMEGPIKVPVMLTIISNEQHRVRRMGMNPFFSRKSVLGLEQIVRDKTEKLIGMAEQNLSRKGGEFDAHRATRALTVDIITEYAYAKSWNYMDLPDWGEGYQEAIRAVQTFFPWLQTFPSLLPVFGLVPDWVMVKLYPHFGKWFGSLEVVQQSVAEVKREIALGIKPARRTIFHELLDPEPVETEKNLAPRQKLPDAVVFADAVNVTGAGVETTGATICRALYEVLDSPEIAQKLREELKTALPDPFDVQAMSLIELEKLPYLTGVIKETLRLSPGVPGHLPRVVPSSGATFEGYTLTPGTVVSMSAWSMHHNTELFPDPDKFDPTRWTDPDVDAVHAREKSLVSFGRGTRNCIGQNLAMCELYYSVASVIRRWDDLKVHSDFGREDVKLVEFLLSYHPKKARKLRLVRT
ncbi:putative cytochrome P450 E-class, group I [Cercophora samala]|uniref:Cytochrome P450 E-class, group I n=1 Tax=Cercophora samala TaxID=330535 RepID=A0AA39ZFG1_9PEZI|nr:putative cytochrome P450 E-class, group I [Cercophora samala]